MFICLEMHIHIAHIASKISPQRESLTLDIDSSITIKQIKKIIAQRIKVPASDQFLSFEGHTLDDEQTLAFYDNIKEESTIWMVIFAGVSRTKYRVFVSIYNPDVQGEIIELDIFYYDTVVQVKQAISARTSIPPSRQRIIFAGKQLEDAHVFSDYGIQKESTVHLVIR